MGAREDEAARRGACPGGIVLHFETGSLGAVRQTPGFSSFPPGPPERTLERVNSDREVTMKKRTITALAAAVAALALAVPAYADPAQIHRAQAQAVQPDGYQPQLKTSSGSVSHPDNTTRSVTRGSLPVLTETTSRGGFDWSDGAAGAATGVILSVLAVAGLVAVRGRRRLAAW